MLCSSTTNWIVVKYFNLETLFKVQILSSLRKSLVNKKELFQNSATVDFTKIPLMWDQ